MSAPKVTDWNHLNLNFKIVARIHAEKCIGCELCYIACWDGAHQCIHVDGAHANPPEVEAASRARITVTPIPKLDRGVVRTIPLMRASRAWTSTSAWAAIYARWFARWRIASRWSAWKIICLAITWEDLR